MKNKKISIITIEIIMFILSLIVFIIPLIIFRKNPYLFLIAIALFILIIAINYYLFNYLSINPLLDINRKLKHYNNNEFAFYLTDNKTQEIREIKNELDKLSEAHEDLTKHLKEKIYENESYQKQYKADIEARKQLVAAISHEIKTPLQIIETTASAILDDVIPEDEIKLELNNIIKETNRTNEMLKEIIAVYKTTMNIQALEKTKLNLKNLIMESLRALDPLIKKYKQKLDILSPLDLEIEVNEKEFKQALNNILVNAIIHSPLRSNITIELIDKKSYNALEIINYNAHLDKEDNNKLFEAFYRSDKARAKKEDNGTGLGLFLVKETLEKHNLDYGLVNVNNGVKFYIIFKK